MKLLKNATIIPLQGTMSSFTGGVFSSDGSFVEGSLLNRGKPAQLQEPIEHFSGTYIYGGCLFGHFGHFIWESLSRLYTIRQCNNYPILFISPNKEIFNIQRLIFKTIGVKNEIYLCKVPTSVRNLIYSPPGSSINPLFIVDEQIEAMACLNFQKKHHSEKIWLSRSKLKSGKVINELFIEEELQKIGYQVVYPEILPFREQVRLISTSTIVAGFDGSQFFSFLFAKKIQGNFFIFNRRKSIAKTIPYALDKRNVEFYSYTFDLEHVGGEGASANFFHPRPENIIDVLKAQ